MVPRLSVHSSGLSASTPSSRSCTVIPVPPPEEMLMTTSLRSLIPLAYLANTAGSAVGRPSRGSRACRCSTAAPASAAATPCSITWSSVYGRCGDIDGVCPEPVIAQVMMTFWETAIVAALRAGRSAACSRYERYVLIVIMLTADFGNGQRALRDQGADALGGRRGLTADLMEPPGRV